MKFSLKSLVYITFAVLALLSMFSSAALAGEENTVMLLEVEGEVNAAMASYIADAIEEAEALDRPVMLVLDTYGGQILEADNIKETIMAATVPVDCYITRNALSAGVLIAISCERIVMADSAVIGAAETIPNDEKTLSTWVGILTSAAEARDRDTQLIAAMADKRIQIDGVSEQDMLLTLGATKAQALGLTVGTAGTVDDALEMLGYSGYATVEQAMSFPVRAAQFLTSTVVTSLLFLGAIVCMGIEIITAGFGVFGILSIIFFGLYLGGGFLAGFAEWWSLVLLFVGLTLFVVEAIVPGFGVFGIMGIISVVAGLLFASRDVASFLITLGFGLVGAIIALPLLYKLFKRLGILRKLSLPENMNVAEGYVSHEHINNMQGKTGVALTDLRPAGAARIDGMRCSVLTSGAYIEKGEKIIVVEHTPGRIVVDELDE